MSRFFIVLLGLFLFLHSSCYKSPTKELAEGLIAEPKLIKVLADVHLAEGFLVDVGNIQKKDSLAAVYYGTIFKLHGVDSASFAETMQNYMQNPAALARVYEKVLQELQIKDAEFHKK
jgi:hypothetical protein